jgi:hypothetical protein
MLQFLRNKIQSLTETQQNFLTTILILLNIGIVIFWIHFWLTWSKAISPKITKLSSTTVAESFKPGRIGEPKEGEKPQVELPPVISNTAGIIKEIQKDKIIILGDGSNFSDQKPRELTLIFTDSTITFEPGQKVKYKGLEGLKHLNPGDKIRISSSENIRGKTEFLVNYVNKL